MKFAREFKAALRSGDYPEEWCKAAIPYPTLKKCLNKIRAELQGLGLNVDSLQQLLNAQVVSIQGDQIPLAKYNIDVSETEVKPHFSIFVDLEDGVIVDASLSPASRAFLEAQAFRRKSGATVEALGDVETPQQYATDPQTEWPNDHTKGRLGEGNQTSIDRTAPASFSGDGGQVPSGDTTHAAVSGAGGSGQNSTSTRGNNTRPKAIQRVEFSMTADSEFFGMICQEMDELARIGEAEQTAIKAEVMELGQLVSEVAQPERKRPISLVNSKKTRLGKYASDLPRWRELFELYLDAQVFFSTRERDHGKARSALQVSRQLDWFQAEVRRRGILQKFEVPTSMVAFQRFLLLNKRLFLNLRFRELNQKAQVKILKKFDKWTALGVSKTFPMALSRRRHDMLVEGMARDVCARIAEDVVAVVPRLEDYTCPVCLSLAWLPVRLRCRHVFCVRCVIKMQRDKQKFCPLCRCEVVMEADLDNLDIDLEKFLKLYFRNEAKEKQKANEFERGVELFGEGYKQASCMIM